MGIIAKALTKSVPFPMQSNKIAFSTGTQSPQNKTSLLRYYGDVVWLRSAVTTIATAVAQVDWKLWQKHKGGEREEISDHPLLDLVNRPNPFQSGHEFRELHQTFSELLGECYHIKQYNQGKPELWIPIVPFMSAIPHPTQYIAGYRYDPGNGIEPRTFKPEEVISFLETNPLDPLSGIGRAQSAGISIESESMMNQYTRNFFYWDASPGTIITYPVEASVTPDDMNRLMEQLNAGHRSYGRAFRAMLLTQGAEVKPSQMGQKDMDFVNLSKESRDKILGAFGISYANIGGTESINRANAEAQLLNFARGVMVPRLVKMREKWNMFLTPDFGTDLELDFDNPVPEDTEAQAMVIDNHVKSGFMSIEEARQMLDLGDIVPDDHFMIPISFSVTSGADIINPPEPEPLPVQLPIGQKPPELPPGEGKSVKKKSRSLYLARKRLATVTGRSMSVLPSVMNQK